MGSLGRGGLGFGVQSNTLAAALARHANGLHERKVDLWEQPQCRRAD